jgi:putative iron-dependent peroxidase
LKPQSAVLSNAKDFAQFITFIVREGKEEAALLAIKDLSAIIEDVNKNNPKAQISSTLAFSNAIWSRLFTLERPKDLVSFTDMQQDERHFPATNGDILLFLKSMRMDLNFQIARLVAARMHGIASVIEDIQGFDYRDGRDMIDFVDGTENPESDKRADAIVVSDEDPKFIGGTYITAQRYVHDLKKWNQLQIAIQEQVIGRTKADDIELADEHKPVFAHVNKAKATDSNGDEISMYRQNMPYGNSIENGTYFLGFARSPEVINIALRKMIYADENGFYDRLLDYTKPVTGVIYFAPSIDWLDAL